MTIISFEYPKKHTGIYQPRVLAVITRPSDSYFGIDIGELDTENQAVFSARLQNILEDKSEEIEKLMAEFDLKYCYRNFLKDTMRNISEE